MSKVDKLKKQYPISAGYFMIFKTGDITDTNKYLEYMLKQFTLSKLKNMNKCNYIVKLIKRFDCILPYLPKDKRDIYSKEYSDIKHLETIVEEYEKIKEDKLFEKNKFNNVETVYEDDNLSFIRIKTPYAANKYGKTTKWCITESATFKNYERTNLIYYLIVKNKDLVRNSSYHKLAFILGKTSSMDGNFTIYNSLDSTVIYKTVEKYYSLIEESLFNVLIFIRVSQRNFIKNKLNKDFITNFSKKIESLDFNKLEKILGGDLTETQNEVKEKLKELNKRLEKFV